MIHRKRNERNIMQPGYNAAIIRRSRCNLQCEHRFIYLLSFFLPRITRIRVKISATHIPMLLLRNVCVSDCRVCIEIAHFHAIVRTMRESTRLACVCKHVAGRGWSDPGRASKSRKNSCCLPQELIKRNTTPKRPKVTPSCLRSTEIPPRTLSDRRNYVSTFRRGTRTQFRNVGSRHDA